jgi:DNA-binding NtrC family response regulator
LDLVVMGPGALTCVALPAAGSVLLGRADDADVRIPDPAASREHARVHVSEVVEVEDLGSVNGTLLRNAKLVPGQRVILSVGEAMTIGSTIIALRTGDHRSADAAQVLSHGSFENRLIEACGQASANASSLALVRLDVVGGSIANAERILSPLLRPGDVIGSYGPTQYEVLLVDTEREAASALARSYGDALTAQSIASRHGLACFPGDGTSPGELIERACERVRAPKEAERVPPSVVVESRPWHEVWTLAKRVAAGTINVLITGETGVGKEVLAALIHESSPRAQGPMVSINCAALGEALLESELFGHERGAFTGAVQTKPGLLETASGGTVLLDEVGEMTPTVQAKLLRVLETRQVMRVGGTRARALDIRIVAATNRDLEAEVARKTFREDLYFRLAGVVLAIPPLRERVDDIEPIARMVLRDVSAQLGCAVPDIDSAAIDLMRAYPWPGNVRELRNMVERALLLAGPCTATITLEHLPADKMQRSIDRVRAVVSETPSDTPAAASPASESAQWSVRKGELEKAAILEALQRCGGNRSRAAEYLGMPRTTLLGRLREYKAEAVEIPPPFRP